MRHTTPHAPLLSILITKTFKSMIQIIPGLDSDFSSDSPFHSDQKLKSLQRPLTHSSSSDHSSTTLSFRSLYSGYLDLIASGPSPSLRNMFPQIASRSVSSILSRTNFKISVLSRSFISLYKMIRYIYFSTLYTSYLVYLSLNHLLSSNRFNLTALFLVSPELKRNSIGAGTLLIPHALAMPDMFVALHIYIYLKIMSDFSSRSMVHLCFQALIDLDTTYSGNFPSGPVVKNLPCNVEDVGWITGRGTKIPQATGQLSPNTETTELQSLELTHHN